MGYDQEQLEEELRDAIENMDSSVDVEEYDISLDEAKKEIAGVINSDPTFFNIKKVSASYNEETESVSEITFTYVEDALERSSDYDSEVRKILKGINSSWTDFQKLMYLHDYIVPHVQYDLSYSKYSAYDAIVGHTSVCQGYAEAYADLVGRAGLNVYVIVSNNLNHAWNLVALNGKYFFVDCTWDDPLWGGYNSHLFRMGCMHEHFLCSQTKMNEGGHRSDDWVMYSYSDGPLANRTKAFGKYNNTQFDNAPWKGIQSPLVGIESGRDIFIDINSDRVCVYDDGSDYADTLAEPVRFHCHWGSSITTVSGKVYINTSENIYRVDTTNGGLTFIYALSSAEKKSGSIYGIEGEGSRIRYDIARSESDADFVKSGYTDAKPTGDVTSLKLDKKEIMFGPYSGETAKITATVEPSGSEIWGTSDPYVATVKNGVVTAVGQGEATIYARAGAKVATCTARVGTVIKLDRSRLDMRPGDTATLTAEIIACDPDYYDYNDGFNWFSTDTTVATVSSDGVVKAKKEGKTYIYADKYGGSAVCVVTVRTVHVSSVSLNKSSVG